MILLDFGFNGLVVFVFFINRFLVFREWGIGVNGFFICYFFRNNCIKLVFFLKIVFFMRVILERVIE